MKNVCGSCSMMKEKVCNGTKCFSISKEAEQKFDLPECFPQNYTGVRFTADAMDCALPISIDSHSGCSYSCLYCFSNNLMRAPDRNAASLQKIIREGSFYSEWSISKLEAFLDRSLSPNKYGPMYELMDAGCPVQLGALGDPFDELELHSGWAKKAIPLFIKYKVPVRISTKGGDVLQRKSYLKLFEASPSQFWFAFSCITSSDELIEKIDIKAPNTTSRLKAMKRLTDMGCKASLRMRPALPGISDCYPGEPEAWKVLLTKSRESGAQAISFEWVFLPAAPSSRQSQMLQSMFRVMGNTEFGKQWNDMSWGKEACRRGSRDSKYKITKAVRDYSHEIGLTVGISDPHFKEWNDVGNCCGLPEKDEWFGYWSRRNMTTALVECRKAYEEGKVRNVTYEDWRPKWAHETPLQDMVAMGNWHNYRRKHHFTFGDTMKIKWNDVNHPRGPYHYFGGVLVPVGTDMKTGDLTYQYQPWKSNKSEACS